MTNIKTTHGIINPALTLSKEEKQKLSNSVNQYIEFELQLYNDVSTQSVKENVTNQYDFNAINTSYHNLNNKNIPELDFSNPISNDPSITSSYGERYLTLTDLQKKSKKKKITGNESEYKNKKYKKKTDTSPNPTPYFLDDHSGIDLVSSDKKIKLICEGYVYYGSNMTGKIGNFIVLFHIENNKYTGLVFIYMHIANTIFTKENKSFNIPSDNNNLKEFDNLNIFNKDFVIGEYSNTGIGGDEHLHFESYFIEEIQGKESLNNSIKNLNTIRNNDKSKIFDPLNLKSIKSLPVPNTEFIPFDADIDLYSDVYTISYQNLKTDDGNDIYNDSTLTKINKLIDISINKNANKQNFTERLANYINTSYLNIRKNDIVINNQYNTKRIYRLAKNINTNANKIIFDHNKFLNEINNDNNISSIYYNNIKKQVNSSLQDINYFTLYIPLFVNLKKFHSEYFTQNTFENKTISIANNQLQKISNHKSIYLKMKFDDKILPLLFSSSFRDGNFIIEENDPITVDKIKTALSNITLTDYVKIVSIDSNDNEEDMTLHSPSGKNYSFGGFFSPSFFPLYNEGVNTEKNNKLYIDNVSFFSQYILDSTIKKLHIGVYLDEMTKYDYNFPWLSNGAENQGNSIFAKTNYFDDVIRDKVNNDVYISNNIYHAINPGNVFITNSEDFFNFIVNEDKNKITIQNLNNTNNTPDYKTYPLNNYYNFPFVVSPFSDHIINVSLNKFSSIYTNYFTCKQTFSTNDSADFLKFVDYQQEWKNYITSYFNNNNNIKSVSDKKLGSAINKNINIEDRINSKTQSSYINKNFTLSTGSDICDAYFSIDISNLYFSIIKDIIKIELISVET